MGRVLAAGEPTWLPSDVDLALSWQAEQAQTHGCGHPLDESTDPANQDAYRVRVRRCFACEARDLRMAAVDDEDKPGLFMAVERRPPGGDDEER